MPFKFHEAQRHHISKQRYRVRNWPEYDRGLVRRGDIRVWLSEDAIVGWRPASCTTPGGQGRFSNLAIETSLILGAVLRLPLRQTEGLVRSLIELMKVDLAVRDHTTLARRRRTVDVRQHRWPRKSAIDIVIDSTVLKFFGAGEWARAKHGETRRSWRKLHISVNPADNKIIAHELTDDDTSDEAMIGGLVADSGGRIRAVIADGAYDGAPVYQAIRAARPRWSPPKIVIPPGKASIPAKDEPHGGTERERHCAEIAARGRMAWQRRHGYGKRSLAETAISRIKRINGGSLTSRTFGAQQTEAAIHVKIANRNMTLASPVSVRVRRWRLQSHSSVPRHPCTRAAEGTDRIETALDFFILPFFVENLTLTAGVYAQGFGTSLANIITGSASDNNLFGYDGADTIIGTGGADFIYGGAGNNSMSGGQGVDRIYGDALTAGNDSVSGGADQDLIYTYGGADTLHGDAGNDWLIAGDSDDSLLGCNDDDNLYGDAGADILNGQGGTGDILYGGSGNDTLLDTVGANWLFGEDGLDTLTGGTGYENLDGGAGNDRLAGGGELDVYRGGLGSDVFYVNAATDRGFVDWILDFGVGGTADTIQLDVANTAAPQATVGVYGAGAIITYTVGAGGAGNVGWIVVANASVATVQANLVFV